MLVTFVLLSKSLTFVHKTLRGVQPTSLLSISLTTQINLQNADLLQNTYMRTLIKDFANEVMPEDPKLTTLDGMWCEYGSAAN